ncbi:chlorohydrolase [Streptococcus pneumoniae]|nr:chlorohydrolase [Streptococcus pneumoniae]
MKLTKSAQNMFEVAMKLTKSHCFEVVDETDKVSNHTYGKVTLTWFEEIFEEYKIFR